MDIDKVNKISTLAALLRSEIAQNAGKKKKTASATMEGSNTVKGKLTARELDRLIVDRIKRLNTDESQFQSKATRIIVESILIWEFGDHIANDPEFGNLIDKITNNIHSSEKLTALYNDYSNHHS